MPNEGKGRVLTSSEFKRVLMITNDSHFGHRNTAISYCAFRFVLIARKIASPKVSDLFD